MTKESSFKETAQFAEQNWWAKVKRTHRDTQAVAH